MSSVSVYGWKKEKLGTLELNPQVFDVEVKKEILHTVVEWQLASRRQGTHSIKTRAFVSGGGKKPFKQKGTGNARQGTSRSPLMPGGAKLFGPAPKDYSYALPKKVRKLGLKMALSYLNKSNKLIVVDSFPSTSGKTKEMNAQLKSLGVQKSVLVDDVLNQNCKRATDNMRNFRYYSSEGVNVFDLLKYDHVVMSKKSVAAISDRLVAE